MRVLWRKTSEKRKIYLTRWDIIYPYWANFFVAKLLGEYLSDSLATVKDIFIVNVSIVLDFLFFVVLAGK